MLSKLLSIVKQVGFLRKFSLILGFIAILVLIWFVCPKLGIHSVQWRLSLMCLFILALLCFYGVRYLKHRRQGKALEKELTQSSSHRADIVALKEKMQRAINALKSSELGVGRGSSALYALPWYMLIGPAAVGKTTLLRNSGLNFPLASDEEVHVTGFGGTRNCDWWFSDQAVILDTAGRYATEVDDKEEWFSFLDILKKRRKKLPVNGIIVAVSISDLVMADVAGLTWHATVVRDRIEELTQRLGYILPVHVVLTKCDLLKGFEDFFKHFQEDEREQVWGVNLLQEKIDRRKKYDHLLLKTIQEKLNELYANVTQVRLHQLSLEQRVSAKASLFDFPAQFHDACMRIYDFFVSLINENPYQHQLNLAGIYFTSGTQQGLGIERNIQATEYEFSTSQIITSEKKLSHSYFVRRLLIDVIFDYKFGAVLSRRMQLISAWSKTACMSMMGVLLFIFTILWSIAYVDDKAVLNDSVSAVKNLANELVTEPIDRKQLISSQLAIYDQYHRLLNHRDLIPFHERMGLYEGDKHLPILEKVLSQSLRATLMPLLPAAITDRLEDYNARWGILSVDEKENNYADYYETLKSYLLLSLQAEQDDNSSDAKFLANVWLLSLDGKSVREADLSNLDAEQLSSLTKFYLDTPYTGLDRDSLTRAWEPNLSLVDVARKNLDRPVDAAAVYQKLRTKLQAQLAPMNLSDLLKGEAANIFSNAQTLPGMYTERAWEKTVYNAIHQAAIQASVGDWVLNSPIIINTTADLKPSVVEAQGNPDVQKSVEKIMRSQYFSDYVNTWYGWLSHVNVNTFSSLDDASSQLKSLSSDSGAMVDFMQMVAKNINLPISDSDSSLVPELVTAFEPLRHFAGGEDGDETVPNSLDKYLGAVRMAQTSIDNLALDSNVSVKSREFAANILQGNGSNNSLYQANVQITKLLMNITDEQAENAINNILVSPLRAGWQAVLFEAGKDIQTKWENQILPAYQGEIVGKFPFQQNSNQDANMNAVGQFFNPQTGLLWQFVQTELQPFVKQEGMNWVANQWLGADMNFSPDLLASLTQAQHISTLLFSNGTQQPSFNFSIYPIPVVGVTAIAITVNGKTYQYQNGPQQWQSMQWIFDSSQAGSQLLVTKGEGSAQAQIDGGGVWSLFKLLYQATVSVTGDKSVLLTWNLTSSDGQHLIVHMKFRTDSSADAITALVAHPFNLPSSIDQAVGS